MASAAARAVITQLEFPADDQDALLDVIQDYFTLPDGAERDNLSEDNDADVWEEAIGGTQT